jgi:DNA-binding MarR family transcriptional regulator
MDPDLRQLHDAVLDLVALINQPQRDDNLFAEAGVSLDRALFPLFVRIERRGPLGVVELAADVGRDYTTVSRQVSKLEKQGLVARSQSPDDARVSALVVTKKGQAISRALDTARGRLLGAILGKWSDADRKSLVRLLRKFTDDAARFRAPKG